MEADILRLILFLVGAAIVFGIYALDRYKRSTQNEPDRDWMHQPQDEGSDHIEPRWDKLYEPEADEDEDYVDEDELEEDSQFDDSDDPFLIAEDEESLAEERDAAISSELEYPEEVIHEEPFAEKRDADISSELEHLEEIIHEEHLHPPKHRADNEEIPQEQMSISFFSRDIRKEPPREENAVELPTKIIQMNIVPREGLFYGDDILYVAQEAGLEPGEMDIFHSYGDDAEGDEHAIFSMVSMVEPGTFPMDDMDGFSTPGLTLFSQLPGPKDGLTIFAEMLHTAEQLANELEGELRDGTHSAITKQTISHMREEIQEYHRQLSLACSKR